MKNILKYTSLLFLSLMMFSCSESLEEINTDPTNPTAVGLDLQLPEVLSSSAFNEGNNPNRVAGIIMQQLLGQDAQQLAYNSYVLGEDVMNNYWRTGLYAGVLRSADVMVDKAVEDGRPFYEAVGKIIMANELGKATACFGDMPFSQAFDTDNLQPGYDTQEAIYGSVQTLLTEAINTLNAGGGGYFGGDLIYGGDVASWVKVAHAFKARYHMHVSKRTGDYSAAMSEAGMAMASNAENPYFQFEASATANHSFAKFGIERPSTLGIDGRFADMMTGDPRQDSYMYTDGTTWWYFDSATGGSMHWAQSDVAMPLITHTEMAFIMAEATMRNGNDASGALATAVESSFDLIGVEGGAAYAAALPDASEATIMTEAYKAYYGFNFHETWMNWRRTGIPALSPTPDASSGLNPSGAVPVRYLYAESESQTNSANVEAAKAAQGGALLDASLWAFQ